MKKIAVIYLLISLLVATGCSLEEDKDKVHKVGMLVENTIHDQVWGQKGYLGLIKIQKELDVDVYFKERIQTKQATFRAVDEFVGKGVNLVFGHGSIYGGFFSELQEEYPNVHFVFFNGSDQGEHITSLNFDAVAMGFFGGMVAGGMTETEHVGIIAAYEWQPEVEGFYEGVMYQNPNVEVKIRYVNDWDNQERALSIYKEMRDRNVDVFYPAGDGFNVPVIQQIKENGLYAIGYVSDQSSLGKGTVLTSTVQHVDKLYLLAATLYNNGELPSGQLNFDFQDKVISLGKFSPVVPKSFSNKIKQLVEQYIESGQLPNEQSTNAYYKEEEHPEE